MKFIESSKGLTSTESCHSSRWTCDRTPGRHFPELCARRSENSRLKLFARLAKIGLVEMGFKNLPILKLQTNVQTLTGENPTVTLGSSYPGISQSVSVKSSASCVAQRWPTSFHGFTVRIVFRTFTANITSCNCYVRKLLWNATFSSSRRLSFFLDLFNLKTK